MIALSAFSAFSLCAGVFFRVSDACFTNHTMLEAQRIYLHSHSQWWPKILPLLCERCIASQLWGDLSAILTIFNAFHLKRATGSTWQNCLKVKLKMVLLFPGRVAGSYKWQSLFRWQLVLHNSAGAEMLLWNEQNTLTLPAALISRMEYGQWHHEAQIRNVSGSMSNNPLACMSYLSANYFSFSLFIWPNCWNQWSGFLNNLV